MNDVMLSGFVPGQAIGGVATPKSEFLLLPREVTLQNGRTRAFSDGEMAELVTAFKAMGRKQVIDYEHQTLGTLPGFEYFMSPDGTAPAAGWIGRMTVRPDGIWAQNVEWTPRASKMLADGEYKYFSPVIFWQGKQWAGKPRALGPVALTNDPDINGLSAVAARCSHAQLLSLCKESEMDFKKLIAELMGLDANAPDEQFASGARAKWGEANTAITASKSLASLTAERDRLKAEAEAARAAGESQASALKSGHGTEVAALKATHAGEITALKADHEQTKAALGEQIASRLEETGRIATSDRAAVLQQATGNPDIVLTAFKSVKVGAVVPVGTLGIRQGGEDATTLHSPLDAVSTSKAFKAASPDRQQLHLMACKYADQHKVSYIEAINAVSASQG